MAEVTYAEANLVKAHEVCLELIKAGYILANSYGMRLDQQPYEHSNVGVLRNLPRKYFLGFIPRTQKREWIGVIYFSDKGKGANNKSWIVEVFGKENVPTFKTMADSFMNRFGVDVHIRLEHMDADGEQFPYYGF